mgnify:CR=1 FL=1
MDILTKKSVKMAVSHRGAISFGLVKVLVRHNNILVKTTTDLTVKSAALGLDVSAFAAGLAAVMNLKE